MNKTIILEKFGFNIRAPGNLNDIHDKKIIQQIEAALVKKPLQTRIEMASVCILMSGAELVKLQLLVNGNKNNDLAMLLAKQARLTNDLVLKIGSIAVAKLVVDYDTQQRRFVVHVEN